MDVPSLGYVDDILDITKCGEDTKEMNEYTTQEINRRKLQLSWDKCARMHIGKKKKGTQIKCEDIFIDKWIESKVECDGEVKVKDVYVGKARIKDVDEYEYLGNVISADGKNEKNIKNRVSKGFGAVRDIRQILEGIYFGNFFIEALLMLRNSMLLSVLTYNLEVSMNLTKKDLKQLDEVDCFLLKKTLNISSKASRTLIHGELGIISVEFYIKQKRILYLHHLLSSETESLARDVLNQMIQNP